MSIHPVTSPKNNYSSFVLRQISTKSNGVVSSIPYYISQTSIPEGEESLAAISVSPYSSLLKSVFDVSDRKLIAGLDRAIKVDKSSLIYLEIIYDAKAAIVSANIMVSQNDEKWIGYPKSTQLIQKKNVEDEQKSLGFKVDAYTEEIDYRTVLLNALDSADTLYEKRKKTIQNQIDAFTKDKENLSILQRDLPKFFDNTRFASKQLRAFVLIGFITVDTLVNGSSITIKESDTLIECKLVQCLNNNLLLTPRAENGIPVIFPEYFYAPYQVPV